MPSLHAPIGPSTRSAQPPAAVAPGERLRSIAARLPICQASVQAAFEAGELNLAFQPIVDVHHGQLRRCEVSLSWLHPVRGVQAPEQFMPVLGRSRLAVEIGTWALESAAIQVMDWSRLHARPLHLALDVSGAQLLAPDFPALLGRVLDRSGLPPDRLTLGITQDTLSMHGESLSAALARVALTGVDIHLSRFRGGPSTLSHLQALALSGLKLDRSLIAPLSKGTAPRNELRTLTSLAQRLGMAVSADGIETESDRCTVAELGVTEVQGPLYCPPLPAAAFAGYLAKTEVRGD